MRRFVLAFVLVYAVLHAAAMSQQPPTNASPTSPNNVTAQTSGNQSPGVNTTPAFPDPAVVNFTSPVGMLIVTVKAAKVADYESAIVALQDALSKSTDPAKREQAAGWRVLKADTPDSKSNAIFIHLLEPAIAKADYRPSLLLDQLLEEAPGDLLSKYRDAIAGGPNKLELTEFAKMSVAPVKNVSPAAPGAPDKPGNVTPKKPG